MDSKHTVSVSKIRSFGKFFIPFYMLVSALIIGGGATLINRYHAQSVQYGVLAAQEDENQKLCKFAVSLMEIARAPISEFQKQSLAQAIVRVTSNVFSDIEERKAFVVLLAIESRFNRLAKSPAGAVGVSQVIPKFATEFAKRCGITGMTEGDLMEGEANITIGACQFKELLTVFDGNVASALVAYNAGRNSMSLKELQGLRSISNMETANYVSKFTYLKEVAEAQEKSEE